LSIFTQYLKMGQFEKGLCIWIIEVEYNKLISREELIFLNKLLDIEMEKAKKGYFIGPIYKIQPRIDWIKKRIETL